MKFNLAVGDVASFSIYPSLLYKLDQTDLTYQGEVTASLCNQFGVEAAHEWAKAYPSLPAGVVNDPEKYPWLLFKSIEGNIVVINEEWIKTDTLVSNGKTVVWVTEVRGDNLTPAIIQKQLSTVGIEILRTYAKGE